MRSFFDAIRPRAARSFVCAAAFLVTWGTGLSAAHADDNSAWFGETYKGTSLGLSAGVMRLGAGSRAEETTEGTTARRGQRGTQVASLGRGYSVSTESGEEEAVARPRSTRRTRTASLGYNARHLLFAQGKRSRQAAYTAQRARSEPRRRIRSQAVARPEPFGRLRPVGCDVRMPEFRSQIGGRQPGCIVRTGDGQLDLPSAAATMLASAAPGGPTT